MAEACSLGAQLLWGNLLSSVCYEGSTTEEVAVEVGDSTGTADIARTGIGTGTGRYN